MVSCLEEVSIMTSVVANHHNHLIQVRLNVDTARKTSEF